MILPSKYVPADRSLIVIGAEILALLEQPGTISEVWEALKARRERAEQITLAFDWFVLALTLLYSVGALRQDSGLLVRQGPS